MDNAKLDMPEKQAGECGTTLYYQNYNAGSILERYKWGRAVSFRLLHPTFFFFASPSTVHERAPGVKDSYLTETLRLYSV